MRNSSLTQTQIASTLLALVPTDEELGVIYQALGPMPHETVAPILLKLQRQRNLRAQLAAEKEIMAGQTKQQRARRKHRAG